MDATSATAATGISCQNEMSWKPAKRFMIAQVIAGVAARFYCSVSFDRMTLPLRHMSVENGRPSRERRTRSKKPRANHAHQVEPKGRNNEKASHRGRIDFDGSDRHESHRKCRRPANQSVGLQRAGGGHLQLDRLLYRRQSPGRLESRKSRYYKHHQRPIADIGQSERIERNWRRQRRV